ncbi:hypothetical protein N9772_07320 [Bacteroidia bacterium]|nr:hypothetical protein [Bacteroidia bacterium]
MKNIVVSLALCLFNILGCHSVSIAQSYQGYYAARNANLATKQRNKNLDKALKITKNDYYKGLEIFNGETVKKSERKLINPRNFKPFESKDEFFKFKIYFHEKYTKGFYATRNDALAMNVKRRSLKENIRNTTNDYYQFLDDSDVKDRKPINPDTGKPFNNLNEYTEYLSKFY